MDEKISPIGISRRDFIAGLVATGTVGGLDGRLLAALAGQGVSAGSEVRVIFQSSFERGQPTIKSPQHQLANDMAHTGQYSLMGQVSQSNQACKLEIPFASQSGRTVHVSG